MLRCMQMVEEKKEFGTLLDCYEEIVRQINLYMDISQRYVPILACWVVGTYFHDFFLTYPYLYINATRGGGKTRLLRLLSFLSKDGTMQVNMSEAVLFRRAAMKTAFFIDELERISGREKANLRLLLNAAYKRGIGVERARKNPQTEVYEVDRFEVFTPIAMANIWGLDDVLKDRCITVVLEKSSNEGKINMAELWEIDSKMVGVKRHLQKISEELVLLINRENSVVSAVSFYPAILYSVFPLFWNQLLSMVSYIKRHLTITTLNDTTTLDINNNGWYDLTKEETLELADAFREHYPINPETGKIYYDDVIRSVDWLDMEKNPVELTAELCELGRKIWDSPISGRNLELFLPLIMVAHEIDSKVLEKVIRSASDLSQERIIEDIEENRDTLLLAFLCSIDERDDFIAIKKITTEFKEIEELDWVNSRWVGRALKRLAVIKLKKRVASGRRVLLDWNKIEQKARQLGIDVAAIKTERTEEQRRLDDETEKAAAELDVPDYLKKKGGK